MIYEGDVYRPPSEAKSLIIQLTIGCARNSCTFCSLYRGKKFRVRELSEVIEDLYWVKAHYRWIQNRTKNKSWNCPIPGHNSNFSYDIKRRT